jgi:hypothetical protein
MFCLQSSGKRRMVMASDSEQEEEDRPVVDDGEDGDSTLCQCGKLVTTLMPVVTGKMVAPMPVTTVMLSQS